MFPAEWGRARDALQTVATHSASMFARRIVIVIAWRGRPAAAVSSAQGSGSKHLLGNRTNSQLLLPPCCIQQPILPFTFLCFRACILQPQPQPRYLHLLLHLSQTPRYLHSATAVLWFVPGLPLSLQHIEHLRWHYSLVTSRYRHVESITRPRTLSLATVDHSLLPFPFTLTAPVPVAIPVPVPGAR
jgi:hypothetical protein